MRYIDSYSRNAEDALGSWLDENVLGGELAALRWQTGFFGGEILSYFASTMASLSAINGPLRVLVGSNNGVTRSKDVGELLKIAGPPRAELGVGIVSFAGGFYHPKTIHIIRADGSAAAYIGSANLTKNGITSVNIEAGVLLDTRDGDDAGHLGEIAAAIDWWFADERDGMTAIKNQKDIYTLIANGVLDRPLPVPVAATPAKLKSKHGSRLKPLVKVPPTDLPLPQVTPPLAPPPIPAPPTPPQEWTKRLSVSDAQRKKTGNQRGSITLVRAGYDIDAQVYFRREFFADEPWVKGMTSTGEPRETATISFTVTLFGLDLGTIPLMVSYASNREADQNNYTSLLHLEGISDVFHDNDLTDKWLQLTQDTAGKFALSFTTDDPRT